MTSVLESLDQSARVTAQSLTPASDRETVTAAQTDEQPLALFLGVNNRAWFFTSRRLLILKGTRRLTRQLAGCGIVDLTSPLTALQPEDVLRQTSIRQEIPVAEISWLEAERMYRAGAVILFARGRRYELTVGLKRAELAPYVETLRQSYGIPLSGAGQAMKHDLRMWAGFCVASGSLTFLLSFAYPGLLEPAWGLAVAVIGAGAWCVPEPAMFIILGCGMVWAAMLNLFGLNSSLLSRGHLPLGVPLQLYWALALFAKYQKFQHLYDVDKPAAAPFGLSVSSFFGSLLAEMPLMPLLSVCIAAAEIILLSLRFTALWPASAATMISRGHLHLAMIGTAVGLASLYSRRRQRRAAITGVTINAVMACALIMLLMTKWHQP
ncbi:MAG TPA: hypothetical protein VNQ79_24185 [Blastocatellia bacterium]|nr:hypothetical protein [Blastocatellia bacterium]